MQTTTVTETTITKTTIAVGDVAAEVAATLITNDANAVIAVPYDPAATIAPPPPTMAERIDAELEADPLGHEWVSQSTISIDRKTAKKAAFRGSFRSEEGMRIDALEVMCHVCRRTYDAVTALDAVEIEKAATHNEGLEPDEWIKPNLNCPGQIDNTHLIGGDLSVRAKRIIHKPVGVIHEHVIDRRGMAGYSVHAGK